MVTFDGLRAQLSGGTPVTASLGQREVRLAHDLSERQVAMVLAGGGIPLLRVQTVSGRPTARGRRRRPYPTSASAYSAPRCGPAAPAYAGRAYPGQHRGHSHRRPRTVGDRLVLLRRVRRRRVRRRHRGLGAVRRTGTGPPWPAPAAATARDRFRRRPDRPCPGLGTFRPRRAGCRGRGSRAHQAAGGGRAPRDVAEAGSPEQGRGGVRARFHCAGAHLDRRPPAARHRQPPVPAARLRCRERRRRPPLTSPSWPCS